MHTFRILSSIAFLGFLIACKTPREGRDWYLYDTKSEWRSTSIEFVVVRDAGEGKREVSSRDGCLEIDSRISIGDNVELWRVYRCEDWRIDGMGVRSYKQYFVTDPPGQTYTGATDFARPEEIPPKQREPVGAQREELSLATYPLKIEWQICATEDPGWISNPNDQRIALSGTKNLTEQGMSKYRMFVCEQDLRKLLAYPVDRFGLRVRVSPFDWKPGSKTALTRDFYIRESITRTLIEQTLASGVRKAKDAPPPSP